jgi:hypothetical protein
MRNEEFTHSSSAVPRFRKGVAGGNVETFSVPAVGPEIT